MMTHDDHWGISAAAAAAHVCSRVPHAYVCAAGLIVM